MSDNYGFEEYMNNESQTEVESGGIKALREKAEADSKTIQELSQRLARFEEQNRQASVASILETAGVNPKAAKFYRGDPDPEKIHGWVAENADVFGLRQEQEAPAQEAQTPVAPAEFSLEQQEAFLRMQNAGIDGTPSGNHAEIVGSLNGAQNMDDLLAAMQRHGWTGGLS